MLSLAIVFFFCKQKTAYEVRISDWSSDVCSSDLGDGMRIQALPVLGRQQAAWIANEQRFRKLTLKVGQVVAQYRRRAALALSCPRNTARLVDGHEGLQDRKSVV